MPEIENYNWSIDLINQSIENYSSIVLQVFFDCLWKMFYIGEPNTENTFPVNFLEHNQTNENVFLSVKYFSLKFILHVAKHSLSL